MWFVAKLSLGEFLLSWTSLSCSVWSWALNSRDFWLSDLLLQHQIRCIRFIALSDVLLLGHQMYGYWDVRCMAIGSSDVWLLVDQRCGYWNIKCMAIGTSDVWLLLHQTCGSCDIISRMAIVTLDVRLLVRQMCGYRFVGCVAIGSSEEWLLVHQVCGYWFIRWVAIGTSNVWHQFYCFSVWEINISLPLPLLPLLFYLAWLCSGLV